MSPARLARAGAALILLAAIAAPFAARLRVDNRIELWVDPHGAVAGDYRRFRETFGSDEIAIVAYEGREIFSEDALRAQLEALERLEIAPHVTQVSGVPGVWRERFEPAPSSLREEMLATPFYTRLLLSPDARTAGLFVETALPGSAQARRELARSIDEAVAPLREHGFTVHVVGPPVLNAALDEISEREALRTFPLAVSLSIAALFFALRCWRATVVASACGGLAILLVLGAMGAAGRSLDMLTSALPSLIWVLGLAGMVHLLWRYQTHRVRAGCDAALAAALRDTAMPSAVAALTTALGFLSLLSAGMQPVREFGLFAAAGMCLSLAVNLAVGPLLVRALRAPAPARPPARAFRALDAAIGLSLRRPRAVLLWTAAAVAGCLLLLPRVRVESDPLDFLPADSQIVRAYRTVSDRLTGYYSLEIVVETPDGWLEPSAWPPLERVRERLEALPGVARVLSPLDFLKQIEHARGDGAAAAWALPSDATRMRRLAALFEENGGGGAFHLVGADGRSVRLSALVRVMPSDQFLAVVGEAKAALAELPGGFGGYATGLVLQLVDAQISLVDTQVRSFGLAFLTIFPCILVGLRSWRLTAVAIPPNLLPILPVFAVMALAGIALDPATVMVASIALGIAVDDTVHSLASWRRLRASGLGAEPAVRAAYAEVGPAMLTTAVAACIGFFSVMHSAFVPIRFFGLLAGTAMAVALVADLLLVPALLLALGRRAERAA
jgi:hypothetical protein